MILLNFGQLFNLFSSSLSSFLPISLPAAKSLVLISVSSCNDVGINFFCRFFLMMFIRNVQSLNHSPLNIRVIICLSKALQGRASYFCISKHFSFISAEMGSGKAGLIHLLADCIFNFHMH